MPEPETAHADPLRRRIFTAAAAGATTLLAAALLVTRSTELLAVSPLLLAVSLLAARRHAATVTASLEAGVRREREERLRCAAEAAARAEGVLREQLEFVQILMDAVPCPIFYKYSDGRYGGCNSSFETFIGRSKEKLVGRTVFECGFPEEYARLYYEADKALLEKKGTQVYEGPVEYADGSRREVVFYKATFTAGGKEGLIGTILDISGRKTAERALRESEERFRLFFETSWDGILITNGAGWIEFANSAASEIIGSASLVGTPLCDSFGSDYPACRLLFDLEKRGFVQEAELELNRADGGTRHVLLSASAETAEDGTVRSVHCILHDVTDRKRVQDALALSERKFRALFNSTSDAIFIHDFSGSFLEVNDALCQRLGYSREELLAVTQEQVEDPRHASLAPSRLRDLQNRGELLFETGYVHKDGSVVPVEVSCRCIDFEGVPGAVSIVREISERKAAERQLRFLSYAVEQGPVSVVIVDRDGLIGYVNPKFSEISGYGAAEVLGRTMRLLFGKEGTAAYADIRASARNGVPWSGEIRNIRKGGEPYWVLVSMSPLRDPEGGVGSYILLMEDITEKRKLEEQLRHSQKMEAVGQLAGGISHDFNNILTAIIGYAGFLEIKSQGDPAYARGISQIIASAERGCELTRSLLAFSRKQAWNPRPVLLNEVVRSCETLLQRLISAELELRLHYSAEDICVVADSLQIEQVLMNLATNARDAMPSGGILSIATSLEESSSGPGGKVAVLTVTDSGCGMSEETMKKMYEPFFTTKDVGAGTGLGLSIVYGIVEQHGGRITCSSASGEGTTLRIHLPLCPGRAAQEEAPPRPAPPTGGEETILVAEDSAVALAYTADLLREYGYRVLEAQDGEKAVELFLAEIDRVDLVILDVVMPKKNGKDAFVEMQALKPWVKVIFTSGYSDEVVEKKGLRQEGVPYLAKPVAAGELLAKVREVMQK